MHLYLPKRQYIYRYCNPQGDGSVKVSGAAVEEGAWHAAALDAWSLLLPLLSPGHALQLLTNQAPSFARLGDLLEAVSLEVIIQLKEAVECRPLR